MLNWTIIYGIMAIYYIVLKICQNHWTMKCRSQWPTHSMRSFTVSDWYAVKAFNSIGIQGKIYGPWIKVKDTGGCIDALQLLHLKVYAIWPSMNSLVSKVFIKTKYFALKTVLNTKVSQLWHVRKGHTIVWCSCCNHIDGYIYQVWWL